MCKPGRKEEKKRELYQMNEEYTTTVPRTGYQVYKERKEMEKHQTYEKGIVGGKHAQRNEGYKLGFIMQQR